MDSQSYRALEPLPSNDDALIRRADLPLYIPVAVQTLARWASEGRGPRYIKIGRKTVAYRVGAVRDWLEGRSPHAPGRS